MHTPSDHPIAGLTLPDREYTAEKIIQLQVEALAENNTPHEDAGIQTAYNFASPGNRASTGPLESFTAMVKNRQYRAMLNHDAASYGPLQTLNGKKTQQVTLRHEDGTEVTYEFTVSQQTSGQWNGCWMTDAVRRV